MPATTLLPHNQENIGRPKKEIKISFHLPGATRATHARVSFLNGGGGVDVSLTNANRSRVVAPRAGYETVVTNNGPETIDVTW